jgi:hypothetical protein
MVCALQQVADSSCARHQAPVSTSVRNTIEDGGPFTQERRFEVTKELGFAQVGGNL